MPRPRYDRLAPEVRDHILEVAEAEFARRGFHDASYNEIIRASGISKGSFYHTFQDKEDLFLTVLRARALDRWAQLDTALPTSDWWGWMERVLREVEAQVASDETLMALATTLYQLRTARSAAFIEAGTDWVQSAIASGQALGEVRTDLPAALLAGLVMAVGEAFDRYALAAELTSADDMAAAHGVVIDLLRRLLESH